MAPIGATGIPALQDPVLNAPIAAELATRVDVAQKPDKADRTSPWAIISLSVLTTLATFFPGLSDLPRVSDRRMVGVPIWGRDSRSSANICGEHVTHGVDGNLIGGARAAGRVVGFSRTAERRFRGPEKVLATRYIAM